MARLRRELTFKDGLPLALGSIIGSGILFLPSLTFSIAGSDVGLVWLVATFLCFPLLLIFQSAFTLVPNESGVEGFVSLGFGPRFGAGVPILILGTVGLGMPASALIVGEYIESVLGGSQLIISLVALGIVWFAALSNLQRVSVSARTQRWVTALLLLVGFGLIALTTNAAFSNYHVLKPKFELSPSLSAITVAFWAYAGFENLTFMAGEFKNPKRDLTLSILVALLIGGALYLGLSANFAALVTRDQINENLGLMQLAQSTTSPKIMSLVVALVAFVAVLTNFNSWFLGISRLVYSSSKKRILPEVFSTLNKNEVPARSLIGLGVIFSINILIGSIFPNLVKTAIQMASMNFVMIYILTVGAFVIAEKRTSFKILGVVVLIPLVAAIRESGWLILYPVFLLSAGSILFREPNEEINQ